MPNDEFDEAMQPATSIFHGQIDVSANRIAWPKGDFKARQPYDAAVHKGDAWHTGIMISIYVTPLDPAHRMISRDMLSFGREFAVVRASVEALAEKIATIRGKKLPDQSFNPLREINKLWVSGEFVPRPDNKPGETWTTLKFVDVFATEDECKAHVQQAPADTPPIIEDDAQRRALAMFLPTLWNQAHRNFDEFKALLQANPTLASTFTLDSPEVKEVCVP